MSVDKPHVPSSAARRACSRGRDHPPRSLFALLRMKLCRIRHQRLPAFARPDRAGRAACLRSGSDRPHRRWTSASWQHLTHHAARSHSTLSARQPSLSAAAAATPSPAASEYALGEAVKRRERRSGVDWRWLPRNAAGGMAWSEVYGRRHWHSQ